MMYNIQLTELAHFKGVVSKRRSILQQLAEADDDEMLDANGMTWYDHEGGCLGPCR